MVAQLFVILPHRELPYHLLFAARETYYCKHEVDVM
jgi:hypothetical protein